MTQPAFRAASSAQASVGRIEIALAVLTLLMFAEAFLPRLLAPGQTAEVESESRFLRYLWLPFYGIVFAGLIAAGRQAWTALSCALVLLVLCGLAMLSSQWSMAPDLSFRRGIALTATTLLGVYLAARYDWLSALRLLGGVWLLLMAMSFLSGLLTPGFGVMQEIHPGAWAGGWWEKNQLGGHAARASFLFAFLAWRDDAHRRLWIASACLALALVILSTSKTALLGALLGGAVLLAARFMLKGRRHAALLAWAGVSVGGLLVLIYVTAPGVLLGLIGREPTLTGRTDIWAELMRAISERPTLGYGYLAFWAPDSEPRYWLAQAVDWNAPSGHNGWLDLAISLGVVGLILFSIDMLAALARSLWLASKSPAGVFAIGFLAQFALFAMSESLIVQQNNILWATYAFISVKLAMEARRASQSITPESTAPRVGVASTAPPSAASATSSFSMDGRTP